jgi:hypothetical protein
MSRTQIEWGWKRITGVCLILALLLIFAAGSLGQPGGPDTISVLNSTRATPDPSTTVQASAGNVTTLGISGSTTTQTWQGYVGNISGVLVLQDSLNFTLYNWSDSSPRGEIFASNDTIDFSTGNIECYNFTRTGDGYLARASYESVLGLDEQSADGVNETFSLGTNYGGFFVGALNISGPCPETQLFNSSGEKSPNQFNEVLLYEKTKNNVIYTAVIEDMYRPGFNGGLWNFEMIVGVNGHNGSTTPWTYYFYIELE